MVHYYDCPVCKSKAVEPAFATKDYTVSGEDFFIWKCSACTLMFTQDVPSQEEIGRYYKSDNYISHSDTRKGIINSLYHQVRNITLAGKRKLLNKETGLKTGNLLDIGSGTGAFLHEMQHAGWNVTGLEPDEGARATAQSLYNINAQPPGRLFDLPAGSFDAITAWHVMEHVHELHAYVEQIKTLLKKNGRLFIAVPNYTSDDAEAYGPNWAAFDVPRHLYHFSPLSMHTLLKLHGMEVEKIKPMWFDSFYVSMLSEQYKNGKGNIPAAFLRGLVSNSKAVADNKKCSSLIYIAKLL